MIRTGFTKRETNMNTDPTNPRHSRDNGPEVDQWLESALHQYGQAEPRPGLENRVLARLRIEREQAEKTRVAWHGRWFWPLGAATTAVVVVIALWAWQSGREARPRTIAKTSAVTQRQAAQQGPIEPTRVRPAAVEPAPVRTLGIRTLAESAESHPAVGGKKHREIPPASDQMLAATPKLDQFPSPQPLSEQEQILMSYVAKYPETAALVAQAQAEALERDREEVAGAAKDTAE
jgi:hypothetical protein